MEIDLRPEDIEVKFVRSRGKGGQNVNKVATCVQLKHIPTGVTVKCEVYRTQGKNRELAYELLKQKLEKIEEKRLAKEKSEFEKEKRRKRKRPKALKEKILEDKRQQSEKKELRKKII